MKRIALKAVAGILLAGVIGTGGYVLASGRADVPQCCQTKQACCPSQPCCSGGSHSAQCRLMHRRA
ncbi:MAG TPA: hypothetical protein VFB33_14195 [Candidatus Binataceae bacterium]|jgi:hypothetical protein|nr:hypothetical protein [Candidatus Binataceae bacterium]